jgi:nuclear pore complex protein Nup107
MADRVGKEVEKFAERVDHWYSKGSDIENRRYSSTLNMVQEFEKYAQSTVEGLKDSSGADNREQLQKSVRRRIKKMAEDDRPQFGFDASQSSQSVIPSIETHAGSPSERVQELRHWQAEAATWDLVRIIIKHYHPEPGRDVEAEKREQLSEIGDTNRYSNNIDIWNRFLLDDDVAKEKEIVLRWLERTAKNSESDIDSITKQLEAESGRDTSDWTHGWLDTKLKLKQQKRVYNRDHYFGEDFHGLKTDDHAQDLVTQLDPDAPTRQKRALAKSDEYYERALWMVCYEMLRRGVPWKEISDWCKEKNEMWRGVSLGAADEKQPNGVPNLSGATVGYLFRRICYCASIGSRTPYESAVYGLLSGDVETVESVCRSWDDHLYARYNALLLSRFDEYLLKNFPQRLPQTMVQKFVFRDAAAKIGSWESSSAEVVELLKSHKATSSLANLPIKLIQGSLIGGGVETLVRSVGEAIGHMLGKDTTSTSLFYDPTAPEPTQQRKISLKQSTAEKSIQNLAVDHHCLRILVHVFIVFREGLGLLEQDDEVERTKFDNVIVAYIEFLRQTKRISLIPLYAAQLDDERAYHCLARILPDITDTNEQSEFIRLMGHYGLDPPRVIAENYLNIAGILMAEKKHAYLTKYTILEKTEEPDEIWPGVRVRAELPGLDVDEDDELMLDALRWHAHLETEIESSFPILHSGLLYLLRKSYPARCKPG